MANGMKHADGATALKTQTTYQSETEHTLDSGVQGDGVGFDGTKLVRVSNNLPASLFSSIKAAYDAGPATGVHVIVGPGPRTETVALTLTAGKPLRISGAGMDATNITWNTAGYFIDLGATDVVDNVVIEDCSFTIGSTATGFIQVGRTAQAYSENNFRRGWAFRNLFVDGPGATVAGKIGMSLTQLISYEMDNVTVKNFARPAIFDRTGVGQGNKVRFWAYALGPIWQKGDATGSCGDRFIKPDFLGPSTGTTGHTVEVDAEDVSFIGALYEQQTTGANTTVSLLHLTANGGRFRDIDGYLSMVTSGTLTNTFVLDANFVEPAFIGTILTLATFPTISFGAPSAVITGSKAQFIGCSAELNKLANAAALSTHVLSGPTASGTFNTDAEIHDHTGMLRIMWRDGYTQATPSAGRGWETFYQNGGDQAITTVYDRAGSAYKAWLIQALAVNFSANVKLGDADDAVGFYGTNPIVQRSGAAQNAVGTTASTQTTPYGYATQAQADAIVTLVNELRAALVALGLIKGSA